MSKVPVNHRKHWSEEDVETLQNLATHNTPTRVIGLKMGRTEAAIQSMASEQGISLEPHNQSPYGPRRR